jgi:lysophospholipase L1-like esterase
MRFFRRAALAVILISVVFAVGMTVISHYSPTKEAIPDKGKPTPSPQSSATRSGPSYLSLGDSLAFGYQPDLVAQGDFTPANFIGYAEDLGRLRSNLRLTNFGCPGETTTTFIFGGCPWATFGGSPHDSFGTAKSQLDAATNFLAYHHHTDLITIDIGSNDLLDLVRQCGNQAACQTSNLPGVLRSITRNYGVILDRLQAAAPNVRILVLNLYNPLVVKEPPPSPKLQQVDTSTWSTFSQRSIRLRAMPISERRSAP